MQEIAIDTVYLKMLEGRLEGLVHPRREIRFGIVWNSLIMTIEWSEFRLNPKCVAGHPLLIESLKRFPD